MIEQLQNDLQAFYQSQYRHPLSLEFTRLRPIAGNYATFAANVFKDSNQVGQYDGIAEYHFQIFLVRASISINSYNRRSEYGASVLFKYTALSNSKD